MASDDLLALLLTSLYGRGTALQLAVDSPTYETQMAGDVPYLDIAGVLDESEKVVTFFAVNRHRSETLSAGLSLQGFGAAARVIDHQVITHPDLHVVNSMERPNEVTPRPGQGTVIEDGIVRVSLPPHSWQMVRVSV